MQSWQDLTAGIDDEPRRQDAGGGASGLARDVELLRCLVTPFALANGGLSVTQLAEATRRESSQVSRVMRTLETVKLVERDANRNYRIGPAVFELAAHSADDHLYRHGMTTIETLAGRIQEPVHLCTLVGTNVRTLATSTPDNVVTRVIGWEEQLVPAVSTSAGRILLVDFTRAQVESRFADATFPAEGESKVVDVASLWDVVCDAKRLGCAVVDEEFAPGWVGASAAVRNHTGRVVAAINVAAAKSRWPDGLEPMADAVVAAATELSRSLGHTQTRAATHLRPV
ncbi:MAG: helix-turn-helix domain-containing protein [Acidimicrobiales bacterium]|nr:helix-turn-helix domain-containing protein [Acidimicrobiales bacterium]